MASTAFARVKKIPNRYKDIVYGWIKQMQNLLPSDNSYFTIVQLVQDLCLLYFAHIIDTKILTEDEQMELFDMVNNQLNNKCKNEWKLLFRASRDGFERTNFYKMCDGKSNTICIIQSQQNNVFGGYTSTKFDKVRGDTRSGKDTEYEDDPCAFIYRIRSQQSAKAAKLWTVQNDGFHAIQHYQYGYLSFGTCGFALYIDAFNDFGNDEEVVIQGWASYEECSEYLLQRRELNGEDVRYPLTEIEVFQI